MDSIPVSSVSRYRSELCNYLNQVHPEIGNAIVEQGKLTDEIKEQLTSALEDFALQFVVSEDEE